MKEALKNYFPHSVRQLIKIRSFLGLSAILTEVIVESSQKPGEIQLCLSLNAAECDTYILTAQKLLNSPGSDSQVYIDF